MTLGLSATGAVVGAALGALALLTMLLAGGVGNDIDAWGGPLGVAAALGAMLGALLAPIAAWTLMRHVPLWRAIAETALGTVLGVGAGYLLGPRLGREAPWEFLFALAGFALAAIRLRLTHRGAARSAPGGPEAP